MMQLKRTHSAMGNYGEVERADRRATGRAVAPVAHRGRAATMGVNHTSRAARLCLSEALKPALDSLQAAQCCCCCCY